MSEKRSLQEELKEFITNGWTEKEREQWINYLELEIQPYYPKLYKFLMS